MEERLLIAIREENTNEQLPLLCLENGSIQIWDMFYSENRFRDINLTLNSYEFNIVKNKILDEIKKKNTFYSCGRFCGSFGVVYGDKCIVTDSEFIVYKNNKIIFERNRHDGFWLRAFITYDGRCVGNKYYTIVKNNEIVNIRKYNHIKEDEYLEWGK